MKSIKLIEKYKQAKTRLVALTRKNQARRMHKAKFSLAVLRKRTASTFNKP
jgi:hypothetical protein